MGLAGGQRAGLSPLAPQALPGFAARVIAWQRAHGRHGLPWQVPDAYARWLSEVMLQQTQVAAVVPYYRRFLQRFPDVATLAAAPLDEVLAHWSGLGYYARARNLHRAAGLVVAQHGGVMPQDSATLATLPGIGRSTAAAVAAFAAGERAAILDGNVRRLLARHAAVDGYPGAPRVAAALWTLAEQRLPPPGSSADEVQAYTQGQMDLGALVCTRRAPRCPVCPVAADCEARLQDRVAALPSPRPVRERPVRRAQAWLLRTGAHVLLQRRPEAGLWGGLWSFPDSWPAGVPAGEPESIAPAAAAPVDWQLRHVFTHFTLEWTVREVCLPPGPFTAPGHPPATLPADLAWFTLPEALALGLPAPVRQVLEQLAVR